MESHLRKRRKPNLQYRLIRKYHLREAIVHVREEMSHRRRLTDMQFKAMMQEYSELRQELRTSLQHQNTMLTLIASTLAVLSTISVNIYLDGNSLAEQHRLITFLFCTIVPGAIAFLGILWLDQVYRQVRLATYTSVIEKKINTMLNMDGMGEQSALYWDHWIFNQTKDKPFLQKVNHYQYYICIGLFLVAPFFSIIFGLLLVTPDFLSVIKLIRDIEPNFISVSVILGGLFYILFLIFAGIYVYNIQQYGRVIDSTS